MDWKMKKIGGYGADLHKLSHWEKSEDIVLRKELAVRSVLVFCYCCNILAQTQWLKTTQTYYLEVLEIRCLTLDSLKLGRQQDCWAAFLLEAPLHTLFPCLFSF